MSTLPTFREGQSTISASQMNFLVSEVRRLATQSAREVLNAGAAELLAMRERTVLITSAPTDADRMLTVRRVRYETNPPEQCEGEGDTVVCHYALDVAEFNAFPDFGLRAIDYVNDAFDAEVDILDDTAPFMRAYNEDNTWRVQSPNAKNAVTFVVVREVVNAGDGHVRVQDVKPAIVGGTFTGVFTAVGDDNDQSKWYDMAIWPHMDAEDFEAFVWSGPVTRVTTVMAAFRSAGLWWLAQLPRFDPRKAPPDIATSDCLVFP